MNEFVSVNFFAEVKMWSDRVLKKVNDQLTDQYQERGALAARFQAGGDHFDEGGGEDESRAQSHKVLQIAAFPVPLNDDRAAEDVSGGSGKPKQETGRDGVHGARRRIPVPRAEYLVQGELNRHPPHVDLPSLHT